MSCEHETDAKDAGQMAYAVVKNTFIEVPEDNARAKSMRMRRMNSEGDMQRRLDWSSITDSDSEDDLVIGTFSAIGRGAGCNERDRSFSPDPDQQFLPNVGATDQLASSCVSTTGQCGETALESSSMGKDTCSPSTCGGSFCQTEPTDASSEYDISEFANQMEAYQAAMSYWPAAGYASGIVADESALYTAAATSSSRAPRPTWLRGEHSDAEHRAFAEARAAAEAHQYNLDTGIETIDILYAMPPAMMYWDPTEAVDSESMQFPEGSDTWYCHSCGLGKYDVCGNFCAYCGVKFTIPP
mmetsp:Transcript_49313/g.127189  ORF Transcript_49313/g.127189 Transcript_49313/m.127189 type:complete len:299 (+) Transcript_49313:61-957(+)